MDLRIKLKIFKEMVNEFRTKNMASTLFVENYFHKKIFVFHVEYNKSNNEEIPLFPTFKL